MELNELVQKAQQGDKEAYGLLYKEYFTKIYRYCLVQLSRNELAQDVAQETFIRAWKSLPSCSFENDVSFRGYLFAIARNLIIDLSRHRKDVSLNAYIELETHDSFEDDIDKKDAVEKLKKTIARLNDQERQIVILRYFEELSHAEIAYILHYNEGALRVRTMRILHKLKEYFYD